MSKVFLSYRRQDNDHALSIYLWLIKRYGRESVFWDRRDIDVGRDLSEVITEGIAKAAALVALIGRDWLGEPNAQGRRKIDSEEDWVRRELAEPIKRNILVLPVLGSGAHMPAAKDLPPDLEGFSRLLALSMSDMRFYPILADSLARAGMRDRSTAGEEQPASGVALRAGTLLRRQAERLQVRAKELIRDGHPERAIDELNEGIELMMALLDFVPGEQALEVELGYIYGALSQQFEDTGKCEIASRYRDLQLGIFQRVKDELSSAEYLSGDAASVIKGVGEVYAGRGDFDQAIEYYRKALEIEPTYQYAWHDLFAAYDALASKGRINLDEMRLALQKTKEFSAATAPGTQVPGLDLKYLDRLQARLRHWEHMTADHQIF
jgi:tetratricopeptide (TPR) repeat protein